MLELKETMHEYYCQKYKNPNFQQFLTWNEFKEKYKLERIDYDLDYLVRYDLNKNGTDEFYNLNLFYVKQTEGILVPVKVWRITKENLPEINEYLTQCWQYVSEMWTEFSNK